MSRYIDANEALRMIRNSKQDCPLVDDKRSIWDVAHNCALSCVEAIPGADVVEVVRCKDCQYWDREHIKMYTRSSEDDTLAEFAECVQWSDWAKCRMTRYDDYCSCGKRREANEG